MLRIMLVMLSLCSLALTGCGSSKSRAQSAPPAPDTTGVFVDACYLEMDSVKVEKDSIFTYDGGSPSIYEVVDRSGDTVFYAGGVISFIHRKALPPAVGHEYFFGYNHRGNRDNWADAMFLQVRPGKEVAEGWKYMKGTEGHMLTCTLDGKEKKVESQSIGSEPAD